MSQRRIKVLQLQNYYNVNASDLAEQIIQALPSDRYEVTTAFLRGRPGPGEPVSKAERSIYFGYSKSAVSGLRLRALWALYRHCRSEGYDAVITHRFKPVNMLMLLNRWLGIRACVGVAHGFGEYDRSFRCWVARQLMTPAWRLVGVSRAVRDYLINAGAGFTPANTRQINNAIDISRAESLQHPREMAREMLGLPADAFVFGAIGRLVPVKGHIHLLRAFAEIKAEYPNALLAIIGEGRARPELEAAVAELGLQDRALLLGAKDDALQYVRAFDAFVMPSLSEGLPLALLEGMSGHLPVIGSDIPSLKPILEDCGGRIAPAGQHVELAGHLRDVLALSAQERAAEGERAYRYLCRAHSIEDFRRQYRDLLVELLEGKRNE
ncbi:glycosyltransferase [Pseudomonas sp. JS3066]|uniref:glycosyltransferase n=1 Tax=unclassified Pseudomonas TaxID=196821 RepID=UPI000EA9EE30|nr:MULTISPECIES: glycosyltransferase [unclassified Pseudomonas]AYF89740.1 glycosyltransferase [Pseudomonas sp. DY-1]MDH4655135.1 glycosyltransferase [Pseudomonas sp. BN606]MRK20350.1 glycosyltransferase [Pseudomonas sp. JG-B]WVK92685.1 glycosyltransferase [Pseudomonas sp. JS3066]